MKFERFRDAVARGAARVELIAMHGAIDGPRLGSEPNAT